jgi:hypothetical protein
MGDNIKMDLKEIALKDMDGIRVAEQRQEHCL